MPYRSEAAFSRALLLELKKRFSFVQRIESGETGRGIPDVYLRSAATEMWLELKNMPYAKVFDGSWQVPWRPGQLAWHLRYYKAAGRPVYTVAALADGFLVIPATSLFTGNRVCHGDPGVHVMLAKTGLAVLAQALRTEAMQIVEVPS
jgi:hypothetical protein